MQALQPVASGLQTQRGVAGEHLQPAFEQLVIVRDFHHHKSIVTSHPDEGSDPFL